MIKTLICQFCNAVWNIVTRSQKVTLIVKVTFNFGFCLSTKWTWVTSVSQQIKCQICLLFQSVYLIMILKVSRYLLHFQLRTVLLEEIRNSIHSETQDLRYQVQVSWHFMIFVKIEIHNIIYKWIYIYDCIGQIGKHNSTCTVMIIIAFVVAYLNQITFLLKQAEKLWQSPIIFEQISNKIQGNIKQFNRSFICTSVLFY